MDVDPVRILRGAANARAIDALRRPEDWPYRTAILRGPPRSGKSLLARWFADTGCAEAIDDADRCVETDLFHRWNAAQERGRPLLLIAGSADWNVALPDLASRLHAAFKLDIAEPDDALAADLMQSMARQRGLALGDGASAYCIPRATRSFAGIERLVAEIDRLTLERKVPATMSIWRDALDALHGPEQSLLL